MLTARRIVRIARGMREDAAFSLVVNKAAEEGDAERVQEFLGVPLIAVVPVDEGVRSAERAGVALLDHAPDSAAIRAIELLADALDAGSIER
jgi:Flp pilus assembly CpaE family ATPase